MRTAAGALVALLLLGLATWIPMASAFQAVGWGELDAASQQCDWSSASAFPQGADVQAGGTCLDPVLGGDWCSILVLGGIPPQPSINWECIHLP